MEYDFIDVVTGELKYKTSEGVLRSSAIGSCIVVACYEQDIKLGIMAHIMLPGACPDNSERNYRYAENAIDGIIEVLSSYDCCPEQVKTFLVGAGNVLKKENDTICKDNIKSVESLLQKRSFKITDQILGGFQRKSIRMDIATGAVYYTIGDENEKALYKKDI
ncbi:MAG: chemotaxis protein CheD [Sedimentisphaeraceae bacterium JB056]